MRSLFIKIFLCFWLANIMVVGVLVLTTIIPLRGSGREGMDAIAGHMLTLDAERALDALDREGPEGLRRHLIQLERHPGIQLFIYNESGQELLGRTAPDDVKGLALRVRQSSKTAVEPLRGPFLAVSASVRGPQGRRYIAAGLYGQGPLDNVLTRPYVLALRIAGIIFMAGIVCYGLARHLIRPIRTLRTSTRRLADGDLTVRVGAAVQKRHDELGDLGRDFDYMAERIDSLVSAQRKLLRDMSHELRSPLARLRVALELARRQTGPEVSGILGRIERETRRLDELIGALLTVARLEGGEIKGERMHMDLAALVHEIVADADFEARSQGRRVSVLRSDACAVVGTLEFLRSAIENVVRNAVRYTAEGTQVEVAVTREQRVGESRAVICVRDHGPGVPEDSLRDIFRPFYRVDDDRDRQTGGTGLGLAIAQQAMRLHDGTISAENAQGGGLLVELTLPAAPEISGYRGPSPENGHHTA